MPMLPFDAATVELKGSNLIEASAGTGKTYSIALMALRLVLQKTPAINIQEILMVTFTKAAVAELELRVRAFIRAGLKVARGGVINDDNITEIVNNAIEDQDKDTIVQKLNDASLLLDETSVLTIHSFCQKILNEFAFETNQIFGSEAIEIDELDTLIKDSFNEFWRKNITGLHPSLLKKLIENGEPRTKILEIVREGLAGKKPSITIPTPEDFLSDRHQQALLTIESDNDLVIEEKKNELCSLLENNIGGIKQRIVDSKTKLLNLKKFVNAEDYPALIVLLVEKVNDKAYPPLVGEDIIDEIKKYIQQQRFPVVYFNQFIMQLGSAALIHVQKEVESLKTLKNKITFNDMIQKLYQALQNPHTSNTLIEKISNKYKAVFIDEFQDTDKFQYFIFKTLFHDRSILFYIGDPKQLIYAWRQADITTYFKAADDVEEQYTMDENFRSSERFIAAMNAFFMPVPDFDSFAYGDATPSINYSAVRSPRNNTIGSFFYEGTEPKPIQVSQHKNQTEKIKAIVSLTYQLLYSNSYTIVKNGHVHSIKPEDIGIIVRTNFEGKQIKEALSRAGIPSITINDSKILTSEVAQEAYYVMLAAYEPNRSNINRALLTSLGGYSIDDLKQTNSETTIARFRKYNEAWNEDGLFVMFRMFLSDHNLFDLFFNGKSEKPDRIISDIFQLIEIIHKMAERRHYDQFEQIQWLKKGIDGEIREGDEYNQQIETDESAVKIVTIHKSKGLEYKIVIAASLDKNANPDKELLGYRNPDDEMYYIASTRSLTDQEMHWINEQQEQENRRLIYVAITRAKYHCFILTSEGQTDSPVNVFVSALTDQTWIDTNWKIPEVPIVRQSLNRTPQVRAYATANTFSLSEKYWRKASFTALSPEHQSIPSPKYEGISHDEYDKFMFRELKKGAQTGNLLHYIFENIDFTYPEHWALTIEKAVKRSAIKKSDTFKANLLVFLHQVLDTPIPIAEGLTLNQVGKEDRLTELEFDFPLQQINMRTIEQLSTPDAPLLVRSNDEMEGIMTGKIDLFFRHNGKYYILDWKSNYLGETTDHYTREHMQEAMNENNYHLQYHIYAVAANKYLSNRLPDWDYDKDFGGVIYLFVRGVRNGADTGIYLARPEKEHIEKLSVLLSGR